VQGFGAAGETNAVSRAAVGSEFLLEEFFLGAKYELSPPHDLVDGGGNVGMKSLVLSL
jgi:hypothetical protein